MDALYEETEFTELLRKMDEQKAIVGVVGLGYVGLPLAIAFARAGFHVVGFDVDPSRVAALNSGICHSPDVDATTLRYLIDSGAFRATVDFTQLCDVDTVSICVPTPLRKTKEPDISYIIEAVEHVARHLRCGQLVVLESTTYPGATEELVLPMLESSGLRLGTDFWLAFSPERIDPGNTHFTLHNTPKVVGGATMQSAQLAAALYGTVVEQIVLVSSTKTAEMVKLLENTFRAVNIGLANELAQMANILGVDVWEVIDAGATKPFGFMPFYPGPGLGGHCIPIDPQYLAWKLRSLNYRARFIELADEINSEMPHFVVDQLVLALNQRARCLNGARILLLGVAYKRNIGDVRESPALDIAEMLHRRLADVLYADSHVPELRLPTTTLIAQPLSDALLESVDGVVIVTDHSDVDYARVMQHAPLVIDTRNVTKHLPASQNLWRLVRPPMRVAMPAEHSLLSV